MKRKLRKLRIEDIDQSYMHLLVDKNKNLFYVIGKGKTLIHHHVYIKLLNLLSFRTGTRYYTKIFKMFSEEFINRNFKILKKGKS